MSAFMSIMALAKLKMAIKRNRSAGLYEKTKSVCEGHYRQILPQVVQKMNWGANELILDHGSGCGSTTRDYLLPMAEKANSKIIALDNSESMTLNAKENYAHERIHHVTGEVTSRPSPLKGIKFNKIFSLYTLHMVDDYKKELKCLYDLLAEDGEIYMIIKYRGVFFEFLSELCEDKTWGSLSKEHLVVPAYTKESEDETKKTFEEIGFQIHEWTIEDRYHEFKEVKEYSDFSYSINSFSGDLPTEEAENLRNIYLKYFTEKETKAHNPENYIPNTPYTLHYIALRVHATKARGTQQ